MLMEVGPPVEFVVGPLYLIFPFSFVLRKFSSYFRQSLRGKSLGPVPNAVVVAICFRPTGAKVLLALLLLNPAPRKNNPQTEREPHKPTDV